MERKSAAVDDAEETIIDVSGSDLSSFGSSSRCQDISNFFHLQHNADDCTYSNKIEITQLNLSRCRLGPNGATNLLSFLSNQSNDDIIFVQQINLQRNAIGSMGGRALGMFLTSCCTYHVDISLNDMKSL